jgi:predicted nucleic acid-binding protein
VRIALDSAILVRANHRAELSALKISGVMVEIDKTIAPPIRDGKDVHVIQTALSGKAEYLCTLDRHFYDSAFVEFCARRGVRIINDVDLIRLIRTGGATQ